MSVHFPVLIVILPLLAAPVCVLLRNATIARVIAVASCWACLYMALQMLLEVSAANGVISYMLGGWDAPYGIEYRIDVVNAWVLLIVSMIPSVVIPFGWGAEVLFVHRDKHYLYYAAMLLCVTGLLGMAATGDAFNVFVFLEISSLSMYTLIAMGNERRALRASYSYLIQGTIGGTFFLIGLGLLYQATGTLNMIDLAHRLQPVMSSRTVHVAFAFLSVGLGIKLALFPLHQWLPNAYTYAPPRVSAFVAATATKVGVYVFVRFLFTIFGVVFVFEVLELHLLLIPLSIAGMFVGSFAAINQISIKRLLAYSSIAQIGYMTLGIGMGNVSGIAGGLVHLFNHALTKGGLFLVVGCVVARIGSDRVDDWAGLGRKMPFTMAALVVGGLSLIGVPGTVGLISKWYLVLGALEFGSPVIAILIMVSSLLAVIYVWRVLEIVFFHKRPEGAPDVKEAPLSMLIPTWILIGATVVFGVGAEWTSSVALQAAEVLLMGAP